MRIRVVKNLETKNARWGFERTIFFGKISIFFEKKMKKKYFWSIAITLTTMNDLEIRRLWTM